MSALRRPTPQARQPELEGLQVLEKRPPGAVPLQAAVLPLRVAERPALAAVPLARPPAVGRPREVLT